MNTAELLNLKNWFSDYCMSFYSDNAEDQKNILLKVCHTYNVCVNIIEIAREESLSPEKLVLAETIALFHDLGRFQQYAKYKTFRDSISVNHGRLGAQILKKEGVLRNLSGDEKELVINTVRFHNALDMPALHNPEHIFFLKLIRDADKLDIWRVFAEYYEGAGMERASAVGLGLPDTPNYSETALLCLKEKKLVTLASLETLNDFKLMQLSWIYDLNFRASFRLLEERDHIKRIIGSLPRTDEIGKAISILREFISSRLQSR